MRANNITNLIDSAPGYNLANVIDQIEAFAGAGVSNVLYNDPRTWNLPTIDVEHSNDHGGHLHVNVTQPQPEP